MSDRFHDLRHRRPVTRLFSTSARPEVVTYDVPSARWSGPPVVLALFTDLHVVAPWVSLTAVRRMVAQINAMPVDAVLLLGDYIAERKIPGQHPPAPVIARALSDLRAPLGVHAILGNHDWADDPEARRTRFRTSAISKALEAEGLTPMNNVARRVSHHGHDLWIVGMDSQRGHRKLGRGGDRHDPQAAFADVPDGAPAILLAHEPDYFAEGDRRPILQVSGHTHGGQGNLLGWRPLTPSAHGSRYAYGHIIEDGRHLVVSGGIGYSGLPLRLGQPPEITLVRLHGSGPPKQRSTS